MALLLFHLVLSSYTFEGVDIKLARGVLDWNLRRYPSGEYCGGGVAILWGWRVFFLSLSLEVILWPGWGTFGSPVF